MSHHEGDSHKLDLVIPIRFGVEACGLVVFYLNAYKLFVYEASDFSEVHRTHSIWYKALGGAICSFAGLVDFPWAPVIQFSSPQNGLRTSVVS